MQSDGEPQKKREESVKAGTRRGWCGRSRTKLYAKAGEARPRAERPLGLALRDGPKGPDDLLVLEPVQEPEKLQSQWLWKSELLVFKLFEAEAKDRGKIPSQRLLVMGLMQSHQSWSMTGPDSLAAAARTIMMAAISVFEKKTDDGQCGEIVAQAERLDVVPQDTFISMGGFIERMTPVLPEKAVSV